MPGGIANFIVNTPTVLASCFLIGYVIPISNMQIGLGTSSVWVGTAWFLLKIGITLLQTLHPIYH